MITDQGLFLYLLSKTKNTREARKQYERKILVQFSKNSARFRPRFSRAEVTVGHGERAISSAMKSSTVDVGLLLSFSTCARMASTDSLTSTTILSSAAYVVSNSTI